MVIYHNFTEFRPVVPWCLFSLLLEKWKVLSQLTLVQSLLKLFVVLRYIINVFTPLNFLGTIYNMVGGLNAAECIESCQVDEKLVKVEMWVLKASKTKHPLWDFENSWDFDHNLTDCCTKLLGISMEISNPICWGCGRFLFSPGHPLEGGQCNRGYEEFWSTTGWNLWSSGVIKFHCQLLHVISKLTLKWRRWLREKNVSPRHVWRKKLDSTCF